MLLKIYFKIFMKVTKVKMSCIRNNELKKLNITNSVIQIEN